MMKRQITIGLGLIALAGLAQANNNPCNYDCTKRLVDEAVSRATSEAVEQAVTQSIPQAVSKSVSEAVATLGTIGLTAEDWAAACDSGSPTSETGCYGNIASPGFASLNKKLMGFSDQVNIPSISTANSIFIQQYNGSSHVPSIAGQSPQVSIPNSSSPAMCAYFTTGGANLTYTGVLNGDTYKVGGAIQYVRNSNRFTQIYYRVDGYSTPPVVVPYYVLCIGTNNPTDGVEPTPGSLNNLTAN